MRQGLSLGLVVGLDANIRHVSVFAGTAIVPRVFEHARSVAVDVRFCLRSKDGDVIGRYPDV
jgi:hypothetical protein